MPSSEAMSTAVLVLSSCWRKLASSLWARWPVSWARTPISSLGVSDWMMAPVLTKIWPPLATKALNSSLGTRKVRIFDDRMPATLKIGLR